METSEPRIEMLNQENKKKFDGVQDIQSPASDMFVEPPSTPQRVEGQSDATPPGIRGAGPSQKAAASPELEVAANLEARSLKSDSIEDKESKGFENQLNVVESKGPKRQGSVSLMQAILAPNSVIDDKENLSSDTDSQLNSKEASTAEEDIIKSEYEQFDDIIIDGASLDNIGEISKNPIIQGTVEGLANLRRQQSDLRKQFQKTGG